jgi:DNA-binding LacI/PurR family transcriptional regulator
MAQDFAGIGGAAADLVERAIAGEDIVSRVVYVPTVLITQGTGNE